MNKCAEEKLKAFKTEMRKINFSGTVMDDVWSEQFTRAALDYVPEEIWQLGNEDESIVTTAVNTVINAFLNQWVKI